MKSDQIYSLVLSVSALVAAYGVITTFIKERSVGRKKVKELEDEITGLKKRIDEVEDDNEKLDNQLQKIINKLFENLKF